MENGNGVQAYDLRKPTITITCERQLVPGDATKQMLSEPVLTMTDMPGGWGTVHRLLAQCLMQVAEMMVQEAKGQMRTLVAPNGHPRVRG